MIEVTGWIATKKYQRFTYRTKENFMHTSMNIDYLPVCLFFWFVSNIEFE